MFNIIAIITYVILTSGGLIAIKLGSESSQYLWHLTGKVSIPINPYMILGVFLYALSFLIYIFLISKFELSYIIPLVTALVYIIIFLAAFLLFKESFTSYKLTAIILIVIGLILLNIKGN